MMASQHPPLSLVQTLNERPAISEQTADPYLSVVIGLVSARNPRFCSANRSPSTTTDLEEYVEINEI